MTARLAYVAACVVFPVLWGLVVVWLSNRLDRHAVRRRPAAANAGDVPTGPMYHI